MTSTCRIKYTYFGHISVEESKQSSKVVICDNLSSLSVSFEITEPVKNVDCVLNDCVFIFTEATLYAYKHQEETLYLVEENNLESSSKDSLQWKWTKIELKTFQKVELESSTLADCWKHWDRYWNCPSTADDKLFQCEKENKYFVCTMFGAFVVENNIQDSSSTIQRIYDSRSPMKDFAKYEIGQTMSKVQAGNDHIVLFSSKGLVFACGSGNHGELGQGNLESNARPQLIEMFIETELTVVDIVVGSWHSCALTNEGDIYGWGWNSHGQLGYSTEEFTIQPLPHPFNTDTKVKTIQCRHNSTFIYFEDQSECAFGECKVKEPVE